MDFAREGGLTPRRQPGTGEREVGNSRGIRKKAEESKPLIKEKHKGKTDGREEGEERERGRGLLRSAPLHQQSAWMEEYEEEAPDQADVIEGPQDPRDGQNGDGVGPYPAHDDLLTLTPGRAFPRKIDSGRRGVRAERQHARGTTEQRRLSDFISLARSPRRNVEEKKSTG
ncbi:Hypothetical protein SMAX5B_008934 [Scophthalmus maximus]|uniref:Uncharacterized protein n=1 Tax=Scophthalmus maximus TaxID=52904 RepID=A0A2U9CHJ2_SCOMX|nr:Hypothetical protein SMAX5B_008934 [Scophthalmus maximus]